MLLIMKREKIKEILENGKPGTKSLVKGWVRTKRASKNVNFININDGSSIYSLQVVADTEKFGEQLLRTVNKGTALAVKGILTESKGSGQNLELNVMHWHLLYTNISTTKVFSICILL